MNTDLKKLRLDALVKGQEAEDLKKVNQLKLTFTERPKIGTMKIQTN